MQCTWSLVRTVEPNIEPVTLDELKSQAHITFDEQDTTLESYIKAGRTRAEEYQRLSYITQTWKLSLDMIPAGPIFLLRGPVQSLTSVTVYDGDNVGHSVDVGDFILDTASTPGRLCLKSSASWPSVDLRCLAPVEIVYVAGYGDNATDVPEDTRHAIMLFGSFSDDNRAADDVELPQSFRDLLTPKRIDINAPW